MTILHDLAAATLRRIDPETAQRTTLWALGRGLGPADRAADEASLGIRLWGRDFANPVGLAAGFDKNATAVDAAHDMGFGFTEIGSVTPRPQAGNPRPRLFRLAADGAVINRMGLNGDGLDAVAGRLARARRARPVGVSVASNARSADPEGDFLALAERLAPLADFLTVDVSCPNTGDGRQFLEPRRLAGLLERLRPACPALPGGPALLVKLSPDVNGPRLGQLVDAALAGGVDGMIVCNTTTGRPAGLRGRYAGEAGGLSGRPLRARALEMLRATARLAGGSVPLIGAGGVSSGADAYAMILAGASLVQVYTALVYAGPALVPRMKRELAALLQRDGHRRVADAVGANAGADPAASAAAAARPPPRGHGHSRP